MKRSKKKY